MIALFSGTSEGRKIIRELGKNNLRTLVFTATGYGSSLVSTSKNIRINSGPLSKDQIKKVFKEREIKKILDATHPYAENISRNLIEVSNEMNLPYYRYERKGYILKKNNTIEIFASYEEIIQYLKKTKGNVMLTIGSKNLKKFTAEMKLDRLYPRILPLPNLIQDTLDCGVSLNNIVGMQGPFSIEVNKALIKSFNIKYLITKNSGKEGGIKEKIEAAEETGIKIIILDKPKVDYPNKYESINKIIESVK
ncbi:MAG: cobalt-precorrin-6A reductase [Eubacteriales bacterium]